MVLTVFFPLPPLLKRHCCSFDPASALHAAMEGNACARLIRANRRVSDPKAMADMVILTAFTQRKNVMIGRSYILYSTVMPSVQHILSDNERPVNNGYTEEESGLNVFVRDFPGRRMYSMYGARGVCLYVHPNRDNPVQKKTAQSATRKRKTLPLEEATAVHTAQDSISVVEDGFAPRLLLPSSFLRHH